MVGFVVGLGDGFVVKVFVMVFIIFILGGGVGGVGGGIYMEGDGVILLGGLRGGFIS